MYCQQFNGKITVSKLSRVIGNMTALCNSINYSNINGNSMNHLLRILANKLLANCYPKLSYRESINLPTNSVIIILIAIMLNLRTTAYQQICCYLETWKEKIGSCQIFILIFTEDVLLVLWQFVIKCHHPHSPGDNWVIAGETFKITNFLK